MTKTIVANEIQKNHAESSHGIMHADECTGARCSKLPGCGGCVYRLLGYLARFPMPQQYMKAKCTVLPIIISTHV